MRSVTQPEQVLVMGSSITREVTLERAFIACPSNDSHVQIAMTGERGKPSESATFGGRNILPLFHAAP